MGDGINDWELDDLVDQFSSLQADAQREALRQLQVVWPVSSALFMAIAAQLGTALSCLHTSEIPSWVKSILDVYESKGLRSAQIFMENVEENYLCRIRGETGLLLVEAEGRLRPYLRAIAWRDISIEPGSTAWTDTETVYLPAEMDLFRDNNQNFLIYKLTATFQLGLALRGTFILDELPPEFESGLSENAALGSNEPENPLDLFLAGQENPLLARELFFLAEGFRVVAWMLDEFPGLIRDVHDLLPIFLQAHARKADSDAAAFILQGRKALLHVMAEKDWHHVAPAWSVPGFENLLDKQATVIDSFQIVESFQAALNGGYGFRGLTPLAFMGVIRPRQAYVAREQRMRQNRENFVKGLALFLAEKKKNRNIEEEAASQEGAGSATREAGQLLLMINECEQDGASDEPDISMQDLKCITINSEQMSLPLELRDLARDIARDKGKLPTTYISSAVGLAGGMTANEIDSSPSGKEIQDSPGASIYDEWDYRRSDFRKNWCRLHPKKVEPVRGSFIKSTLAKYKGQLALLRRQFEMIVNQDRFMRGQPEGDEIDIDAAIDSLADIRAGQASSERLYIRLQRNQRSIAALFLVDMSSSTEGWINTALKEALILMCESLEVLGDRYAIYGFSGMRRQRCEIFQVKTFSEQYDEITKGKIAAIAPREYTRMGPAIRHSVEFLREVDARVRLLITLSDGKPEDYDDYKGVYAIEDTRHALIEAKSAGIHPFCITVDHEAHDYISHMYGEVNYVFIDDVLKLPRRIPEIYRNLTT